jgi:signal transduction histidine kinase/tetratricopeptide (TPR) repeat protein
MKRICFPILLFCVLVVKAQTNKTIDSLEKVVRKQEDTTLIKTYNELTWHYRTVDQNKAIDYANKAIALSLRYKFDKGIAQAYNDLGIIYYDKQNFDTAIVLYNKAFEIRKKNNDLSGMAKLYNKIGVVYQKQGNFDKALENQLNALRIFEQLKDNIGISYSLNNIGIVNQNMGLYDEAIRYQLQSIAIKEKINDRYGLAGSYVNVGNIYLLQNNYPKAKEFYLKAEKITRELGDKEYLSNALNNLSRFYIGTKEYKEALPYVNESFALRQGLGDTKGMVSCLINHGKIFIGLQQYDSAEVRLNKALYLAKGGQSCKPEMPALYETFTELYETTAQPDKALAMHKLFASSKDSIYTTELGHNFAELQTKYETLQKEKQIQEQQFKLAQKNYWIGGSIGLLILISLLSYSYYHRRQLKQEAKMQIELIRQQELAARAVIEAEEAERQRIAKDLHDGVGQMMSAAKMNLSAVESYLNLQTKEQQQAFDNIIQLVDDSCKEVRSVSHNMMPNALIKNSLAAAIREFVDKLDQRVLKVHLYEQGLDERLDSNMETILYRIIQECVNNVIKHSGANTLDITIIKESNEITATIEDNGKGFDTSDPEKFEGIGLKNMRTRIAYLKGTIDIDSSPGNGTVVALHVPLG